MAPSNENATAERPPVKVTLRMENEPLGLPLIEVQMLMPFTVETLDGLIITFPPQTEFYIPCAQLGWSFFKSAGEMLAAVQMEEEERWLRMTPEQVETARAIYIPF